MVHQRYGAQRLPSQVPHKVHQVIWKLLLVVAQLGTKLYTCTTCTKKYFFRLASTQSTKYIK